MQHRDELAELQHDYGMLRKLKKGKISEHAFDIATGLSSDSDIGEDCDVRELGSMDMLEKQQQQQQLPVNGHGHPSKQQQQQELRQGSGVRKFEVGGQLAKQQLKKQKKKKKSLKRQAQKQEQQAH
jgi:hypothetical protein